MESSFAVRTSGMIVMLLYLTGAPSVLAQTRTDDFKTRRSQGPQLCATEEKTDAAERSALETYTSPALKKALLSSGSFWNFITDPSTPYMDRMAAANGGGSVLQPEELSLLWEAMSEIRSIPTGVSPSPCSAIAGMDESRLDGSSRVVLGRAIRLPKTVISYPVTKEERDRSPWIWQMQQSLSILFDKSNMYYGDIHYPARVQAAWKWPLTAPLNQPGEVVPDPNYVKWNRTSIRSRALTEAAPHDILLFQTILKLALNNDDYYVAHSSHVQDLWSWGPDHHLEELAQTAQIIVLQKTRWRDLAEQAAFGAAQAARYKGDMMPHAKLIRTANAILAVGRWAMDKSIIPWDRYYAFVEPICKIADDAPCSSDQLRDPNDPRLAEKLETFEAWFEKKKPTLELQAEGERSHLRSLANELQTDIK